MSMILPGEPRPSVTWWQSGALLDDNCELSTEQFTRNSLHLQPLTRADLLKQLTCVAINSNLTDPLSATVTLDLTCTYYNNNITNF